MATSGRDLVGLPGKGGILRLSPGGKVLHRAALHSPHDVPATDRSDDYTYVLSKIISTTDNAVVLGGAYGPGPGGWWWGKFSVNGVRIADRTSTKYYPMTVDALSATPGGGFAMVYRDYNDPTTDVVLEYHAVNGGRLARIVLVPKSESHAAAFTSDGRIVVMRQAEQSQVLFFSSTGARLKEVPWPAANDWWIRRLVADGPDVVVLAQGTQGDDAQVTRLDRDGAVVWRTAPQRFTDVVSRGGEAFALVHDTSGETLTLLRLVNP